MNKLSLVIKREYLLKARKKSFLIMTLLAPVLLVCMGILIVIMTKINHEERRVLVLDKANLLHEKALDVFGVKMSFLPSDTRFSIAIDSVENGEYFGLLNIPENLSNIQAVENSITFSSAKDLSFQIKRSFEVSLEKIITRIKIKNLGIDPSLINQSTSKVELIQKRLSEETVDKNISILKEIIAMIMIAFISTFIMMYAIQIMRNVIEEKSNRIVEIIISSIRPFQLMMGKIIGSTLVAITQIIVWVVILYLLISFFNYQLINEPSFAKFQEIKGLLTSFNEIGLSGLITGFIIYFTLGFGLYSAIYTALGSAMESDAEAHQFQLPISLPIIGTLYFLIGNIGFSQNTDGPVIRFLSFFPLTSPVAMIGRLPYGVPLWEIMVSVTILILSLLFITYLASKIYRTGILMYGKKASLKEILRWIKS